MGHSVYMVMWDTQIAYAKTAWPVAYCKTYYDMANEEGEEGYCPQLPATLPFCWSYYILSLGP